VSQASFWKNSKLEWWQVPTRFLESSLCELVGLKAASMVVYWAVFVRAAFVKYQTDMPGSIAARMGFNDRERGIEQND